MNSFQKAIKIFAICLATFIIINIFWSILYILSFFNPIDNTKKVSFSEVYNNISKIDIESHNTNIKIIKGLEFKVEAQNISKNLEVKEQNNVLEIIDTNDSWFLRVKDNGIIIVTVPKDLRSLSIEAGTGKVEIVDINAQNLDLDLGAGSIKISDSKFDDSNIEGGVGKTTISNTIFNELDFDAGVGQTEIDAYILNNSTIKSGVGEIKLHLLGNKSDYELYLEKGIGEIKVDDQNYSTDSKYGNGDNKINISSGVGKIKVSFEESTR